MKKIMIFLIALSASTVMHTYSQTKEKTTKDHDDDDWSFNMSHAEPGTWKGNSNNNDERVYIQFAGKHRNYGRSFRRSELGALPEGKEGSFSVTREAGTLSLIGTFENSKGRGTYSFSSNATFKTYLTAQGFHEPDNELMLNIFFTDINKAYIELLKTSGYTSISDNDLKDLAEHDLDFKSLQEYMQLFKEEKFEKVSLERIVELRDHGASASFINGLHKMGFESISLDMAQELKDHGVSGEFIQEFKTMGYNDISLQTAIDMRDHGVHPEYISSFQKMGYKDISLERARDLRDHGVDPEFINSFQRLGYKDISLETAQELRDHGVSPEFIRSLQELGYKSVSLELARNLRDHGVSTDFVKEIRDLGFKDLSLETTQELRDHGVSAGFIKKMRAKGINTTTISDYVRLKDSGME